MLMEQTGVVTNCYLLYERRSREAALIDMGGPVETLLARIEADRLDVRYLIVTHGHPDHVVGLPALCERFPEARVCMHQAAYRDLELIQQWLRDDFGQLSEADFEKHPELAMLYEFDPADIGEPGLLLNDGDTLALGSLSIGAIHTPGHSPGSVCLLAGDMLFGGDVLFKGAVGRVDLPNSSPADQERSIRRLLTELPETTKVYPGHGQATDIGSEQGLLPTPEQGATP
jgi:glyoxylase-like metal-dependent hydrolase (beta-lactamase superfamily II)